MPFVIYIVGSDTDKKIGIAKGEFQVRRTYQYYNEIEDMIGG